MTSDILTLGVGTFISYISSLVIYDGILGGITVMTGLMITLRSIIGDTKILHSANAWVALVVLAGYVMTILVLPRCYMDRHGSRFCRETNPDTTGSGWLGGMMMSFFLMGMIVVNESHTGTPFTPVGWLGIIGALVSIVCVGIVVYGMRSIPITRRETQHLYLRGAFVDTPEQSVRILPGYTSTPQTRNPAYLGAFDLA